MAWLGFKASCLIMQLTDSRDGSRRRIMSASVLLLGLFIFAAPGHAQQIGSGPPLVPESGLDYRDPAQAPPSWAQFSKLVKYRFETWISADEPMANRLRSYLIEHGKGDDGQPWTLTVRVWLNPDGTVERVKFPPLGNDQADTDLETVLKRGNIGEAPPPEMLQPVNLRFSLNLKK
jgi:hypothetical protein